MPDLGGRLASSRDVRRMLADRAAAELSGGGEIINDPVGTAVYRFGGDGPACTLVACARCLHLSLIPSLPAKPVLYWTCPSGHTVRLEPPLPVLMAKL